MKQILESVIMNLVDNREQISIEEIVEDENITYKVTVAQEDMGRVIGKQGRVAKAIRVLMKSLGSKDKKRVTVEFVG